MDITLLPTTAYGHGNKNKDLPRSRSFTKTVVMSITLLLALAAIVGACAVVVVVRPAKGENASFSEMNPMEISLQDKEKLHSMVVDNHMASIAKRQGSAYNNNIRSSCYSNITNNHLPLAHVSGTGIQWRTEEEHRPTNRRLPLQGYQSSWKCQHQQDLISGGMNFSQDTQELIFPICGFYYFSSQVLFQYSSNIENNINHSVRHGIEVTPNCGSFPATFYRYSYSSQIEKQYLKTSTYLGDILKMCVGGSIRLIIPTRQNLCCAHGGPMNTYFSAFLIHKTLCD